MGGENVVYEVVPKNEKEKDISHPVEPPKGFGVRHAQIALLFVSLSVGYMLRAQLSVSMVAMTGHNKDPHKTCVENLLNTVVNENNTIKFNITKSVLENNETKCEEKEISKFNIYRANEENNELHLPKSISEIAADRENNHVTIPPEKTGTQQLQLIESVQSSMYHLPTYDWHKSTQEMIVFSFFAGYTSMQVPMGYFAQKCGGKLPIMMALAVNGVISLVMPWLPLVGWIALCFGRLIQGMTQAAFYPSIHTLLGKWAPLSERSRLSTYVYTGSQFGTIVIFQISGLFAGSPVLGWPAIFWLCGVLSLLCCGLLAWLGSSSPHEHPSISTEEMTFIMQGGCADESSKSRKTPWKHILTSKPVWGLITTHAGSAAGYILILTQIPTYMSYVLKVDIKKNGLYSSLPYIAMYGTALCYGVMADYVANKRILSIVNIRRIANTTGMVLSGLFLIGFSYVTSTVPAVCVLIVTMSLHSSVHVGFHINHIDLAPNFAGPIMAIGNTVANLTSLLVPVIVSNVVRDDLTNQSRWQIVFLIFAILQFVTNTVFVLFAKGTVQPWNFHDEHDDKNGDTMLKIKKTESTDNSVAK